MEPQEQNQFPDNMPVAQPPKNLSSWLIVLVVVVGVVVFAGIYYFFIISKSKTSDKIGQQTSPTETTITTNNEATEQTTPQTVGDYIVVVKENSTDKLKSDIYLKDKKTGQENLFITITDVYRNHYHNSEYHNGNVYIIRRTGGDFGYQNNPNWTDELWKYNQQKQGTNIYSNRGLDFRVSDDEKFISVFDSGSDNTGEVRNITFLKNDGSVIKILTSKDLGLEKYGPYIDPLVWSNNILWIESGFTVSIEIVAKIDPNTFQITKFDLANLPIQVGEFSLNPIKQKIAFSDYPALFDTDSADEFKASKKTVSLFVYDLLNQKKQIIVTSVAKAFHPKWIDENTIEYDNPSGDGRLTKVIQ